MTRVYLDANVLVPSYTRTLLVMAAPLSDFTVVWSLYAESEAERHQEAGAAPISALRRRFGWAALVPDGGVDLRRAAARTAARMVSRSASCTMACCSYRIVGRSGTCAGGGMTERFWYLKALSDRWMWILDQLPEPEAEEDYEQCEAIASGDLSSIDGGPVVFKQFNRAKRVGDMVWTTGSMKVASDGFVAALERIGATGWRSFPVEIHLPKGERLTGYQGIASTGVMTLSPPQRKLSKRPKNQVALWDGSEICGMHGRQSWRLIVTDRVLQALREDGADRLEVEEFDRPVVRQQATDGD